MTLEESIAINLAKLEQKKSHRRARLLRAPTPARRPFDDGWGSSWRHAYSDRYFEQLFGYEKPEPKQNAAGGNR